MAKHAPWYRVVTASGEKSEPMSKAAAELVVQRTGGRMVACVPPTVKQLEIDHGPRCVCATCFKVKKGLH